MAFSSGTRGPEAGLAKAQRGCGPGGWRVSSPALMIRDEGERGCQDGCQVRPEDACQAHGGASFEINRVVRPEGIEPPALRSGAARSVR